MWDSPSWSAPSSIRPARMGTGATSAVRRTRKAWILPPLCSSVWIESSTASVTQNWSNRTPTIFLGICQISSESPETTGG